MKIVMLTSERVFYREEFELTGADLDSFVEEVADYEELSKEEIYELLETSEGRKRIFNRHGYSLNDFFEYQVESGDNFEIDLITVDDEIL